MFLIAASKDLAQTSYFLATNRSDIFIHSFLAAVLGE